MEKKNREAILELWREPIPNEDEYFKGVRESILKTLSLMSAKIDFLEPQLHILKEMEKINVWDFYKWIMHNNKAFGIGTSLLTVIKVYLESKGK